MHGGVTPHEHVLDRPAARGKQGGGAGDVPALRDGGEVGDAVGARDGDEFGVGIDRQPGLHLRDEVARFPVVHGGPHAADFDEAQVGARTDEAGVEVQPFEVEHAVRLCGDGGGDFGDFAAAHEHVTGCEGAAGHGVDGGAAQQQGFSGG